MKNHDRPDTESCGNQNQVSRQDDLVSLRRGVWPASLFDQRIAHRYSVLTRGQPPIYDVAAIPSAAFDPVSERNNAVCGAVRPRIRSTGRMTCLFGRNSALRDHFSNISREMMKDGQT